MIKFHNPTKNLPKIECIWYLNAKTIVQATVVGARIYNNITVHSCVASCTRTNIFVEQANALTSVHARFRFAIVYLRVTCFARVAGDACAFGNTV